MCWSRRSSMTFPTQRQTPCESWYLLGAASCCPSLSDFANNRVALVGILVEVFKLLVERLGGHLVGAAKLLHHRFGDARSQRSLLPLGRNPLGLQRMFFHGDRNRASDTT